MAPKPKNYIADIASYIPGKSVAGAYKLSSNENPLGCSEMAKDALKTSLDSTQTYPDGTAGTLRSVIGHVEGIDPDNIIVGAGSDEVIGMVCQAYLGAGDAIVQSAHGFLMYSIYAAQHGAETIFAPEKNLTSDVDAILGCVTPKTKIVFLANPNNPTGTYIPAAEVARLRAGLREDILLVLDGAYAEYVQNEDYDDGKTLAQSTANTFVTRTFSKIHGLASLRVGWGFGHRDIIAALHKVRSPFNVSMPGQLAASAAIQDTAFVEQSVMHNAQELQKLAQALDNLNMNYTPSVGNFLLLHGPNNRPEFAATLFEYLADNGIITRLVGAYGLPNALRISIGTRDANASVIDAMTHFCSIHT